VLSAAFYGTAIGALVTALLAALLQLLAAEPHEAWSRQRSQRSKQVGFKVPAFANVGLTPVSPRTLLQTAQHVLKK
jgi:hypothetical protein